MLKAIALALTCAFFAYGQVGADVIVSDGPQRTPHTVRVFRDGSNNVEYVCTAQRNQAAFSWTTAASTLTSIVDSSNTSTVTTSTAHGLRPGNKVTITGASDADLNGTYYIQTVGSTTTFTITTASVTDATYSSGLTLSTRAPRGTAAIWTIQKFIYTTTYVDDVQWSDPGSICDNRAVTTGATKVTYQ